MHTKGIALLALAALLACGQAVASGKGLQGTYKLYRSSPLVGQPVHVATFDTAHGETYNRENCETARKLFEGQPGVIVRYWCEPVGAPAPGQIISLEGSADCGTWLEGRTQGRAMAIEHYLLGMLNGMVVGRNVEFWRVGGRPSLSREAAFLWMDGYCRREPLAHVVTGATFLMEERTVGEWSRRGRLLLQ